MTRNDKLNENTMTSNNDAEVTSPKKADANQSFLRAARGGKLQRVIDHLESGVYINTSNANGLNALHLASKEGHLDVVKELLNRGADVNAATKKGNTALHIASLAGQSAVCMLLVECGASVNVQSQNGFTPLYMAAQENHTEVVKFLLASQASQTLATDDGFTPLAVALQQGHEKTVAILLENDSRGKVRLPALHIAAKKDDVKAASLLLNNDTNVDHQSASGFTPLHIASHYGNVSIASLLIERGANVNFQAKNNITPLHVSSKWGNLGMVKKLVECNAELECRTRDGLTPLHCASRSGHDTIVDFLLQAGANFSSKTRNGLSPLHMSAQGDHIDSARFLLHRGANVDDTTVDYLTPIHVAAHCGNVRMAKLLLDRHCEVNARALNGFTPLHIACKKNRTKVVELLLKYGALIEATTESGLTPLHVAAFMGHVPILVLLLQHGANPNAPTMRCETALHLATRANQVEIVRLLLRNNAQVDAKARENQTPLHIAVRLGNPELVMLLLQQGANPDNPTKDNYTATHIAAKEGHEEVMQFLIKTGAKLETTTKKGFTPLHIASKYNRVGVATMLLEAGANANAQGRNGLTPLHVATHYGSEPVVAQLLEYKASPHNTAKNGYTPLHISAKKNLVSIGQNLLQHGADSNAESRNGFTAIHLASQEGHLDMVRLLMKHKADVNYKAKNGLSAMHLAAQEDRVKVAELLESAGCELDSRTKAGYTPLHTACHFGQVNMIRYLLGRGAVVNQQTYMGSTALHLAAQQGHLQVVYILLDSGADPNIKNQQGWTAAHVARRQHYLNIFEVLKRVTTIVESWIEVEEEVTVRMELERPEVMGEHPVSDSEDDGAEPDFTTMPASPLFARQAHTQSTAADVYRPYFETIAHTGSNIAKHSDKHSTVSGLSGIREDSIHEGVGLLNDAGLYNNNKDDTLNTVRSVGDYNESGGLAEWDFTPDNVPITRKPITSGFLVSFLVDARGGSMRGSRHTGLRILVPPSSASAPTRVTCRMLRMDRVNKPPQLNDGEGLACRVLEMGPHPCKFNSPVLIEVPHFASLRDREREIVILRSENGETWKEHTMEATEQAVQDAVGPSFDSLESNEELKAKRIVRILTSDFPQYFALVTRLRQETVMIGSDGGVISSTVVPQVQAVFPDGALQKRIRVGLQAHHINPELVAKVLGNRIAVSPIVTVEPRRRKFHKPITLTISLPRPVSKGMVNPGDTSPTLRLLCSITGGTAPAQWEDITGSTPLSRMKDCVSFTTTVSARFWLIDCQNVHESGELAGLLYQEAIVVPYLCKFVIFGKRIDSEEALLRCFCVTDDKVEKTLECQEAFELLAASPEVEVLDERSNWLETAGNLIPVAKMGEQLFLHFRAFRENRLPFPVRIKDPHQDAMGKFAFMRDPRSAQSQLSDSTGSQPPPKPICTLEVRLSSESNMNHAPHRHSNISGGSGTHDVDSKGRPLGDDDSEWRTVNTDADQSVITDTIARSELDLREVADEVGCDWQSLAHELGVTASQINEIASEHRSDEEKAFAVLLCWRNENKKTASGNELERALRRIGREDVVKSCMKNIAHVKHPREKEQARRLLEGTSEDHDLDDMESGGPSALLAQGETLRVCMEGDEHPDVMDDRDMIKESESMQSSDFEEHRADDQVPDDETETAPQPEEESEPFNDETEKFDDDAHLKQNDFPNNDVSDASDEHGKSSDAIIDSPTGEETTHSAEDPFQHDDDREEIAAEEDEMIQPEIDERHPVAHEENEAETAASREAKTQAYLELIDKLDTLTGPIDLGDAAEDNSDSDMGPDSQAAEPEVAAATHQSEPIPQNILDFFSQDVQLEPDSHEDN